MILNIFGFSPKKLFFWIFLKGGGWAGRPCHPFSWYTRKWYTGPSMAHYFGSLYFCGTLEMVQCATTMVHSTIDGTLHGKLVNHTFDFENRSLVLLFSPPCPPICPKISPKCPQNLECTKKNLYWPIGL